MNIKQLDFGFMKKMNQEVNIELSNETENKLIEQMAVVLIQVNSGGELENDDPATE